MTKPTTAARRPLRLPLAFGLLSLAACDPELGPEDLDDDDALLDDETDIPDEIAAPEAAAIPYAAPINLALGRPTSQSSTVLGGAPSRAVDGDTDGHWDHGSVTHTEDNQANWWQVDLESVQPIGEIVVWNRTDCCTARLHDFTVEVSADGVNWESFVEPGAAARETHVLVDRPARYVRIDNGGTDVLSLAEVEVFRTRNLAYGKPATQSSTALGAVASRAVDGNTNSHWNAGTMTHTEAALGWWQVDLESVQPIGHVVLWNRTDCCTDKLRDFTVSVSVDGQSFEGVTHHGPAGDKVVVAINRDARYVRIDNAVGQPLHLAEVQVFERPTMPGLSYGRGVGTIPGSACGPGQQLDAGLCYPLCASGYHGVGPVCWQDCPADYSDTGVTCTNWGTLHTFFKHSYGRGVGTVPGQHCAPGQQLDAGLCYPECALGYVGVGPVCWLDDVTIESISAEACGLLRLPFMSAIAEDAGVAITSGLGLGVAAGATGSVEIGTAYGPDGEFGCYVSACAGVAPAVSLSAYGTVGAYDEFASIAGTSTVEFAGFSVTIPETPISVGGAMAVVTNDQLQPIGATVSASLAVGVSTPIELGAMACTTGVLQAP